jgi:hypothetical protein
MLLSDWTQAVEKGSACRKVNKASGEPKEEKQSPGAWSHCLSLLGVRELWAFLSHPVSHLHMDTPEPPSTRSAVALHQGATENLMISASSNEQL